MWLAIERPDITGCELCLPPCPVDCIALVDIAAAPLARADVLARAAHARERHVARDARRARTRKARDARQPENVVGVAADIAQPMPAPDASEPARPIARNAVLEAIARGKARRLAAKDRPT